MIVQSRLKEGSKSAQKHAHRINEEDVDECELYRNGLRACVWDSLYFSRTISDCNEGWILTEGLPPEFDSSQLLADHTP